MCFYAHAQVLLFKYAMVKLIAVLMIKFFIFYLLGTCLHSWLEPYCNQNDVTGLVFAASSLHFTKLCYMKPWIFLGVSNVFLLWPDYKYACVL